ncbi:Integrin alpha-2 [Bulinus truncatus]|nr:Integrin alpha-2 [Bulinus truncatus]
MQSQINRDRFTPINVVAEYSLEQNQSSANEPVLDATKANNKTIEVTFVNECGTDGKCEVNLILNADLHIQPASQWPYIVVNHTKELTVEIGVINKAETAYGQMSPLMDGMVLLGGQTVLYFMSCGLAAVGLSLVIIGVATPEWTSIDVEYQDKKILRNSKGLWRQCKDDICVDITENKTASLEACETFGLLSVLAGVVCLSFLLTHLILQSFKRPTKQWFLTLAMIAGVFSAVFVIITVCVWSSMHHQGGPNIYFGYSLILTAIGGALLSVAGFLGYFSLNSHLF